MKYLVNAAVELSEAAYHETFTVRHIQSSVCCDVDLLRPPHGQRALVFTEITRKIVIFDTPNACAIIALETPRCDKLHTTL